MATAPIQIDIEWSPASRAALDVLDLASELRDVIPEWCPERHELIARAETLKETCHRLLTDPVETEKAVNLAIEKYLKSLCPWDLTLEIDGRSYRVRPLTVGDLMVLERTQGGGGGSIAAVADFVATLFEGDD